MTFIKSWFIDAGNKTGCRFLIVDAYNENIPLNYYLKNGFKYLFSTEAQEVEYTGFETGTHLKTRLMYFDLIDIMPYPNNSSKDSINAVLKGRFYIRGCAFSTNDKCLSLHRERNTTAAKC